MKIQPSQGEMVRGREAVGAKQRESMLFSSEVLRDQKSIARATRYVLNMNYCTQCGGPVIRKIPAGDNLPRHICGQCQLVHYHNPKIVAGCIPEWEDQILLCRRAIEPKSGLWTFPAGFMEIGESTEQAAIRETKEEAQADIEITALHAVLSLPHIGQVYLVFRGRMLTPAYEAGIESLEAKIFPLSAIPWGEIAFPVVHEALRRYVGDVTSGRFQLHVASLPDRLID